MTMLGLLTGVSSPAPAGTPAGTTSGVRAAAFADALRRTLVAGETDPTTTPLPGDQAGSPNGAGSTDAAASETDPLMPATAIADGTDASALSFVAGAVDPPSEAAVESATARGQQAALLLATVPPEEMPLAEASPEEALRGEASSSEAPSSETVTGASTSALPSMPTGAASADAASHLPIAGTAAGSADRALGDTAGATVFAGPRGAVAAASAPAPPAAPSAAASVPTSGVAAVGAPAAEIPPVAPASAPASASASASVEAAPASPTAEPAAAAEPARPASPAIEHPSTPRPTNADLTTTAVSHVAPATTAEPVAPTIAPAAAPAATAQTRAALHPQVSAPIVALTHAAEGEHTITLTVSPENLGPVTVRAHMAGGALHVELVSATDSGREALRSILTDLRRDLAAAMPASSLSLGGQDGAASSGSTGQNTGTGAPGTGSPGGRGAPSAETPPPGGGETTQDTLHAIHPLASTDGGIDVYA